MKDSEKERDNGNGFETTDFQVRPILKGVIIMILILIMVHLILWPYNIWESRRTRFGRSYEKKSEEQIKNFPAPRLQSNPALDRLEWEKRQEERPKAGLGAQGPVRFDQNLSQLLPKTLPLRNEWGKEVTLGRYLGKLPLILVFAYWECPNLCSMVLSELAAKLTKLTLDLGSDYRVVTISIRPHESLQLSRKMKDKFLDYYLNLRPLSGVLSALARNGLHFLTGGESSIGPLAQAAGIRYIRDSRSGNYVHPGGLVILTPEGRVSRYLLGVQYSVRDLKFSLMEASSHKIGSLADQLILWCSAFDPARGKYNLTIHSLLRIFCLLTLAFLLGMVGRSLYQERK